ncbi:hypothetical protein [Mycobacterium deserti]|uniref:Uncharacterized protein n=1 Tax=Mycobacterium deserti TaxID=2978347 RepID=A0ABT2MA54_9MYCO|nr:hypothetical protein [Mycobacterium deserti]MCT7658050.1 hypothetical protein [Mycobacterium deserti]
MRSADRRRGLTFAESRAWVIAAADGGWDTRAAERMRTFATTSGAADLELPASWTALYARRFM